MKKEIVTAIGLHCSECKGLVNVNYAYLEGGLLYVQGLCSECQEPFRFSTDVIMAQLLMATEVKGKPN